MRRFVGYTGFFLLFVALYTVGMGLGAGAFSTAVIRWVEQPSDALLAFHRQASAVAPYFQWGFSMFILFGPLMGYVPMALILRPPVPDDVGPIRSGSLGSLAWFDFPSRSDRFWSNDADVIRQIRARPVPPLQADGLEWSAQSSVPGLKMSTRAVFVNGLALSLGTCLAVAGVAWAVWWGVPAAASDVPRLLQSAAGVGVFVWMVSMVCYALSLAVYGRAIRGLFSASGSLPSKVTLTDGYLDVDGNRIYLRDSELWMRLEWGVRATFLHVENRTSSVRIRGDHQTLRALEDHLRSLTVPRRPDEATLSRLQRLKEHA